MQAGDDVRCEKDADSLAHAAPHQRLFGALGKGDAIALQAHRMYRGRPYGQEDDERQSQHGAPDLPLQAHCQCSEYRAEEGHDDCTASTHFHSLTKS
jgi:hypothetical protein